MRAFVRACGRACVRAGVRACVCSREFAFVAHNPTVQLPCGSVTMNALCDIDEDSETIIINNNAIKKTECHLFDNYGSYQRMSDI